MIITQLSGGLGNQLFQYAAGRCLAQKFNTELKLNAFFFEDTKDSHNNIYRLNNFNVQENFATREEILSLPHVFERSVNGTSGVFNPEILDSPDNIHLVGHLQSEKYFSDIADIIRREFTLKNPLEKNSAAWREKILAAKCAVSLHVRHGDYLVYISRPFRGLLPVSYYQTCINELRKDFPDITIFVFSDDMQWCKENFKFDVPTEFVEGCEHAFEEIHLMSLCKHNIISNSTFSWWGAWLNENPDKKVFAPYPWHVSGFGGETVIPESWIKIPANYFSAVPPMLSIILYVENQISTLPIILQSIFTQIRRDYEVIFVDASTDGSGQICRQTTVNPNVNIITVDPSANKFSAWNKGLDAARGDYVLFLSCKDFIFHDTLRILADVCDSLLLRNANSQKIYMTYGTLNNYMPNVVCATQMFIEDDGGNISITEFSGKTFAKKTDASLPDLNENVELSLTAEQKLLGLAMKSVNNFVCTKLFKRKFLVDQKIKFNETAGGGMDAELTFAVETFLKTDKITFVPKFFSGQLK